MSWWLHSRAIVRPLQSASDSHWSRDRPNGLESISLCSAFILTVEAELGGVFLHGWDMSTGPLVDKIDPFKRSPKKKPKQSQGSSRYHSGGEADLQPLPLLKGMNHSVWLWKWPMFSFVSFSVFSILGALASVGLFWKSVRFFPVPGSGQKCKGVVWTMRICSSWCQLDANEAAINNKEVKRWCVAVGTETTVVWGESLALFLVLELAVPCQENWNAASTARPRWDPWWVAAKEEAWGGTWDRSEGYGDMHIDWWLVTGKKDAQLDGIWVSFLAQMGFSSAFRANLSFFDEFCWLIFLIFGNYVRNLCRLRVMNILKPFKGGGEIVWMFVQ